MMNPAPRPAKNTSVRATSSGVPRRSTGVSSARAALSSAVKLADYLITAIAARKRVYLIDYHKAQISEYARDIV